MDLEYDVNSLFSNYQINMLTQDELLQQLSATIDKTKVNKLSAIIREQRFALRDLIDLTFYPDKTIAFRAAWLLENTFLYKPGLYLPDYRICWPVLRRLKIPVAKGIMLK
jgi:hypothetical protein